MKVAYLVNQYPKTSHSFVRREIEALEKLGVDVARFAIRPVDEPLVDPGDLAEMRRTRTLLAEGDGGGKAALLRSMSAVAFTRPVKFAGALASTLRLGFGSDRGVARHLAYLAEACLLLRWLASDPVEHLHAHFGTNSAAVALLCAALGGPAYSFTAHGTESFEDPRAIGLALKIARARFVVAVSQDGRARLERASDAKGRPPIHVVHCGVDRGFLDGAPERAPSRAAIGPRLVCVARWSPEKGLPVLLEAARDLAREGREFELVLVGDGPLRGAIEEQIARDGLGTRVRLAGWLSGADVRREVLAARALVLPSLGEGLPVVIMEALALSRPVVATAVGGVPELVREGETGWLVPPGDARALAAALRRALDADDAELERLGRAGRASILEGHDAERESARLKALFAGSAPSPLREPRELARTG